MNCNLKLFLCDDEGEKFFGKGPAELLENIDKYKSINKAAAEMYMSYHKALNIIKAAEEGFGCELVIKRTGGKQGGGSSITAEAKGIIESYKALSESVSEFAQKAYKLNFTKHQNK